MLTPIRVGVRVSGRPPEKVTHKRSTASLTPEMTKCKLSFDWPFRRQQQPVECV